MILPRKLEYAAGDIHLQGEPQDTAHAIIRKWAEMEAASRLRMLQETQLETDFLTDVFGKALGYALFSDNAAAWELQPKFKVNGLTADAALGSFTPGREEGRPEGPARVLIELKGPTVNVDRDRFNGRTPVRQLWDYLNDKPECPWGIVCNYVSFRLYHQRGGTRAFEHFTLHDMAEHPDQFRQFYALFHRDGLLPSRRHAEPRADRLLRESGERQREVGDELYKLYSEQREGLIHHLHRERRLSLDEAIHIAQRLIDRIIFIAFCQSRGLIPGETLQRTWKKVPLYARATNPRWRNFLALFQAIDAGHEDIGLERGYNGLLFKPDPAIDDLELDDRWTKFFHDVGEYDFRDEINVDVLGQLFERSITELEKLRVHGFFGPQKDRKSAGDMPKSAKRKRLGVYYTPQEFTELIVRETLGVLMEEQRQRAAVDAGFEAPPRFGEGNSEPLRQYAHAALSAARGLRIVDPACGSGAFLIAAYEFLDDAYTDLIDLLEHAGELPSHLHQLREQKPDWILRENLYGVDLSPEAVEITQLALWLRSARLGRTLADLSQNIRHGNSLVDDPEVDPAAFDWKARFATVFPPLSAGEARGEGRSGFDCVIGNPPWERLKLQEREYFSLSAPQIAGAVSAAKRREMIAALEKHNPEVHARYLDSKGKAERALAYARQSDRYPLTGKGDINTYMLFVELARSIVGATGMVGLLLPSGIATDDTTKAFFAELMNSQALKLLYDFENKRGWFPDVDRRFKFSTLVFGGAERKHDAADFAFFIHEMEELEEKKRHIPLSIEDLKLFNPNTRTCPIFRSRRDAELTQKVYRNVPILIDTNRQQGGNPWNIRFLTMFHQTNDAELFHTRDQLKELGFKPCGNRWKKGKQVFLPLYEAKMVQAFDHRAAGVIVEEGNWMRQGQTKATSLVEHQNPEFTVEPRWWVDQSMVSKSVHLETRWGFLGFKDITSPTNQRTMIAASIPWSAVTNHFPLMLTDTSPRREACLLGNLNAHILDYSCRQKIGGVTLNFFIVEQLPILPPERYADKCPWNKRVTLEKWISERVLKVTCTANDMIPLAEAAGFEARVHKWNPEERAKLRAELDAAFFHVYRIGREDVEYILSTFQGLRETETLMFGESSAEQILAEYDRLAE